MMIIERDSNITILREFTSGICMSMEMDITPLPQLVFNLIKLGAHCDGCQDSPLIEDASIKEGAPNSTYGSRDYFEVTNWPPSYTAYAVIRPTGLNSNYVGMQVVSATLRVHPYSILQPTDLAAYRLLQDTVEAEVTWNSRKTGTSWYTPGAGAADDNEDDDSATADRKATAEDQVDGYDDQGGFGLLIFDLDLTDLVQAWIDGTAKEYGVLLIMHGISPQQMLIHSHEETDPIVGNQGLSLIIKYEEQAQSIFCRSFEVDGDITFQTEMDSLIDLEEI